MKEKQRDLQWMKEIEDPYEFLDKDMKLVYEYCGIDIVIKLLEKVPSINIYTSSKSITKAQELYIREHFTGKNTKELAVKLDCSEMHVYDVQKKIRAQKNRRPANQKTMFED